MIGHDATSDGIPQALAEERSRRKAAEARARLLARFGAAVARVAQHVVDGGDEAIQGALGEIASALAVDQVSVYGFSPVEAYGLLYEEWLAPGLEPTREAVMARPTGAYAFLNDHLLGGRPVRLDSVRDIPADHADERRFFAALGVRSLLVAPLVGAGRVLGGLGAATRAAERAWTDDDVAFLEQAGRLLGALCGRALAPAGSRGWADLFRDAHWGTAMLDPDERIEDVNPAFAAAHGASREALAGRTLLDLVPPEEAAAVEEHLGRARQALYHVYATRHRRADGSAFPVVVGASAHRCKDGRAHLRAVSVFDITELRRMEAALRESEERYRTLFENSPDAIVVLDASTGRFDDANGHACALLGWPLPELRRLDLAAVSPHVQPGGGASATEARRVLEAACRGEKPVVRWTFRDARGHDVPCEARFVRLPSVGRQLVRASISDIRESLRHARLLEESRERFRALAEASFDGVAVSRDGVVLEVNQACADMFGFTPEEMVGMTPGDVATREGAEASLRAIRGGRTEPYVITGRRRDGSTFPLQVLGRTVTLQGEPWRITGFRDLTRQVEAEETQRRLEEQVRYAQKLESLGVLAGGIAHDFNNLLVGVLGNADLLAADLPSDPELRARLDEIRTSALRAAELTAQLLAYAGEGRFQVRPVSLDDVLDEMGELLALSVSHRALLVRERAPGLPPVRADVSQLRQVVVNLVVNASEALDERGGAIRLRTGVVDVDGARPVPRGQDQPLAPGRYVTLEVEDPGRGMDEATLARIFEPFFTTKFTGRGLGLAAVHGILRGHGGAIEVESRPGVGSVFRVLLPAHAAAAADAPAPGGGAPAIGGGGATLLVVDDEPVVRDITARLLAGAGYRVLAASDGLEAVGRVAEGADRVDLVLLDMMMPRMDGREALVALRRVRPDLPIVLTSGYAEADMLARFEGEGPTAFIQKPWRLDDLLRTVAGALAGRRGAGGDGAGPEA